MDADERFMQMAIDLACQARGRTSPNPMVGAVLVSDGIVIGTGYHKKAGAPHAEAVALNQAEENAKGSTLYVNLEPCSHYGRTPPCVEAIIKAGVRKVVAAIADPNPLVSGQGFKRLSEAGVMVKTGVMAEKAYRLNEIFIKYVLTQQPFVLMKTAMTLDGKIATREGFSRWITGEKARHSVHCLRDQVDAIVVGIDTILKDDPSLTTRLGGREESDAVRVVVDSKARLPLDAKVVSLESRVPTVLATTDLAPPDRLKTLEQHGIDILKLPGERGRVSIGALIEALGKREITSLILEGGGELNYSFLEQGYIDKIYFFVAPLLCGGVNAPTPLKGRGARTLQDSWVVEDLQLKKLDQDFLFIGYPVRRGEKRSVHRHY